MKYLLTIVLLTFGLHANKLTAKVPGPASASISFTFDARVETLYYVFLLSGYPALSPHATAYKTAALTHFSAHKNHPAVHLAAYLIQRGFVADYAVNWLFQHTAFPNFTGNNKINFPFHARPLNADTLELFRKSLISFYHDAHCEAFIQSQQSTLNKMVSDVKKSFGNTRTIAAIERYFGTHCNATYTVILSPLLHSGGFTIERTDVPWLWALVGPGDIKDSLPIFDKTYLEQDLIVHEFSHNYANPITQQFLDASRKYEATIFPAIKKDVREEGYATWDSYIIELITRATTIRIVEKIYGKTAAATLADYEKTTGFKHAVLLADELKFYETHRDTYPTLKEFFPRLLKRLAITVK